MSRPQYHTISQIVATVYCERQALLDRQHGEARTADVHIKAAEGIADHKRFEREGKALAAADRRCFIASAIYGPDAPETNEFRAWRDRVLRSTWAGRMVIATYYRIAPSVATVLLRRQGCAAAFRWILNGVLRLIRGRP